MESYNALITATATVYGLDPHLIMAIATKESSLHADAFRYEPDFWERYLKDHKDYQGANPRRVSSSYGLMQIMFPTARESGFDGEPEELFVPSTNLRYGCVLFKQLLDWADGNEMKALGAYNGGKGNWDKDLPQQYAQHVLALRDQIKL